MLELMPNICDNLQLICYNVEYGLPCSSVEQIMGLPLSPTPAQSCIAPTTPFIKIKERRTHGRDYTSHLALVIFANASWIIFPLIILFRMGLQEHPFTRPAGMQASGAGV
jgi:hypothetical protein